jgi:hypothetical protein
MRQRHGTDLVVIDSLAHFLPAHTENSASALVECLTPLQRLTTDGVSVLLPHHPRKGKTVAGQASRGSGALPGFVDIIIEMGYYSHPDDLDRRRRLVAFSRHDQTPRHLLIELLPDGTDYVVLQSGVDAAFGESWQAVLQVLTRACTKQTRHEILENWPDGYDRPDSTTLWRWLGRAVAQGVVRQEGAGHSSDPFRYWLPAREEWMRPDGGTPEEMQAWNNRILRQMFDGLEENSGTNQVGTATHLGDEDPPAAAPATVEQTDIPPESAPSAAPTPQPSASDSPAPEPPSSGVAEPQSLVTPEVHVRLPYPFNLMNPADVPEEVWRQARSARER